MTCHFVLPFSVQWWGGKVIMQVFHRQCVQTHIGLLPVAIKLNPSWKTEVSKSAWIKPCSGNLTFFLFLFFFHRFYSMSDEYIYLFGSAIFLQQEGHHKSWSLVHLLKFGQVFPINCATEKWCNVLTWFNIENILSRLALLMRIVNKSLVKSKMSFHVFF